MFNYVMLPLATIGDVAGKVAEGADTGWGIFATPVIIIVLALAIGLTLRMASKRFIKVPNDKALVVFGGGKNRVVTGGSVFIWPIFQDYYWLDLTVYQFEIDLQGVPTKDRIPVNIKANGTCRISNTDDSLLKAARSFGKANKETVSKTTSAALEGHLRVVLGQIDMDTILSKRDEFNAAIQKGSATELQNLGCEIVILNLKEVRDEHGIIEAMGKPKAAEIKAEALIQEADQTRRQKISVTNAEREGAEAAAENMAKIAAANQKQRTAEAQADAEIAKAEAKAAQAGPLATAEAEKGVKTAQVAVEEAEAEARTALQAKVEEKNRAEYKATMLTKADAEKEKAKIDAEGVKQASIIKAEGEATARTTKANAEKDALASEGHGESEKARLIGTANAEVAKAVGEAEAAAEKAKLLAKAEGEKAQLLALAEGAKAQLLADAEGRKALIDAYKQLDQSQMDLVKLGILLDRGPAIIDRLGEAGAQIMREITQGVMAGISNVDSITVYDSAGGSGEGGLARVAKMGPSMMFEAFQQLQANGMLPIIAPLLKKYGIDVTTIVGPIPTAEVATAEPTSAGQSGDAK